MLAPVAEVEFGEAGRRMLELGLRSAEMWPAFAAELEAIAGRPMWACCDRHAARRPRRGRGARARAPDRLPRVARAARRRLRPSEAREREPALAPTVRLALEAPEDHSVDPRLLLAALRGRVSRAGCGCASTRASSRIELDGPARASRASLAKGGELALRPRRW
jgi:glycine oxidase